MSTELVTRAYNRFDVDHLRGVITKYSKESRLQDESNYYATIQKHHKDYECYFPRFTNPLINDVGEYQFTLEYLDYPTLSTRMLDQSEIPTFFTKWHHWPNNRDTPTVFETLDSVLTQWDLNVDPQPAKNQYTYDMYIKKTETEQQKLLYGWEKQFGKLFTEDVINLNGVSYLTFDKIWPSVREYIEQNMLSYNSVMIHGDCCFSNILYSNKGFAKFIDPRGSFGKPGIFGDRRYDVAKLYHSVDGKYEYLINDQFSVSSYGVDCTLEYSDYARPHLEKPFEDVFFPKYSKKEMKILQGCIYIGMCARHYDSLKRQTAMYLTGLKLLNEGMSL